MATEASDDIRRSVAEHLEVESDDLVLVEDDETSFTFRHLRTGRTHTANVDVGPEGPVVTIDRGGRTG